MTSSEEPRAPEARYALKFVPAALDECKALDGSIKEILRKLLKKRLVEPRVPGSELRGALKDCCKIRLRKQGYRLVCKVEDLVLMVLVLAIDKRVSLQPDPGLWTCTNMHAHL